MENIEYVVPNVQGMKCIVVARRILACWGHRRWVEEGVVYKVVKSRGRLEWRRDKAVTQHYWFGWRLAEECRDVSQKLGIPFVNEEPITKEALQLLPVSTEAAMALLVASLP